MIGLADAHQTRTKRLNFTMTLAGDVSKPQPAAAAITAVATKLAGTSAGVHQGIYFMIEHPPNRDSRITLVNDQRDAHGRLSSQRRGRRAWRHPRVNNLYVAGS